MLCPRTPCGAGEALRGWRVYPLQLEDLSALSYASGDTRLAPAAAQSLIRPADRSTLEAAPGNAPGAATVGPIFYRCPFQAHQQQPL